MFPTIFKYIALALEIGTTIQSITALIESAQATHVPITGSQIDAAIQPVVSGIEGVFPKVVFPEALLTDIENASADAINRYVLGLSKTT